MRLDGIQRLAGRNNYESKLNFKPQNVASLREVFTRILRTNEAKLLDNYSA